MSTDQHGSGTLDIAPAYARAPDASAVSVYKMDQLESIHGLLPRDERADHCCDHTWREEDCLAKHKRS